MSRVEVSVVVEYLHARLASYPLDVFPEPPAGEHGRDVDACSARAIRFILGSCISEIESGKWREYIALAALRSTTLMPSPGPVEGDARAQDARLREAETHAPPVATTVGRPAAAVPGEGAGLVVAVARAMLASHKALQADGQAGLMPGSAKWFDLEDALRAADATSRTVAEVLDAVEAVIADGEFDFDDVTTPEKAKASALEVLAHVRDQLAGVANAAVPAPSRLQRLLRDIRAAVTGRGALGDNIVSAIDAELAREARS